MERQKDSFNCGVYVTAWAESAKKGGKVENCLRKGKEIHFRKKMYKALTERVEIDGGNSENKDDGRNNGGKDRDNSMKMENDKYLDKYLKKKTISHIREMIGLCSTMDKEHKNMLIGLMNGSCKEKMVITFMNYVASDEYNTAPEEVENDQTVWQCSSMKWTCSNWIKWASSTIKQRRPAGLTTNEIRVLKLNGRINSTIMDKYIKRLYHGIAEAYVHETIIAQRRNHEVEKDSNATSAIVSNKNKVHCLHLEKNYIPILIKVNDGVTQWIVLEIEIKKMVIKTYSPAVNTCDLEDDIIIEVLRKIGFDNSKKWKKIRASNMNKQANENQSGVFVAAWLSSLVKTGKITNSINSGYVDQFRDKMFMKLKIKDRNKLSGIGNCYEVLMKVMKYRNDIYNETILGITPSIPI
jgi:hypothetical protein